MRHFRIFWCFFIISLSLFSQKKIVNIDSVYTAVKNTIDSPEKVDKLINLYKQSIKQKQEKKEFIEKALEISERIFYIKGIATSYNRKGISARYDQDYGNSIMYHKRALSFIEQSTDTLFKIKCLNNLGVTYRKLNLEKEAFESYFKALKLAEKMNHTRSITISLNGLGNVLINTEQYESALVYLKKALEIETTSNNLRGQEYGLANIGEIFLYTQKYDSARFYFHKSLDLALKNPRRENAAIKYTLLGLLNQKEGRYKESNDSYLKAIPDLIKHKNTRYLSNSYINLGLNQLHLKEYTKAFKNITNGLEKAKAIKSKENITLGYKALTAYYSDTKNYEKALLSQIKATDFHDSIVNETSQRDIIRTKIAYETEKKDAIISDLANQQIQSEKEASSNFNRFMYSVFFSVLIIGVLLIIIYLLRKNNELKLDKKNKELQEYVLKLNTLKKSTLNKSLISNKDLSKRLKEFELSKREIEVLTHISNGLSNLEIAQKMFISNNTIKTHITHIYSKLDVKNRVQAIRKISS